MERYIEGQWSGAIPGTDAGLIFLDIKQDGQDLQALVYINHSGKSVHSISCHGQIKDNVAVFDIKPGNVPTKMLARCLSVVEVKLVNGNTMRGSWSTTVGTVGKFEAYRSTAVSNKDKTLHALITLYKMLGTYCNDHYKEGQSHEYPESLDALEKEYGDLYGFDSAWAIQNLKYLGKAKRLTSSPDTIIAYNSTMLSDQGETYVLFNDTRIELISKEGADALGFV